MPTIYPMDQFSFWSSEVTSGKEPAKERKRKVEKRKRNELCLFNYFNMFLLPQPHLINIPSMNTICTFSTYYFEGHEELSNVQHSYDLWSIIGSIKREYKLEVNQRACWGYRHLWWVFTDTNTKGVAITLTTHTHTHTYKLTLGLGIWQGVLKSTCKLYSTSSLYSRAAGDTGAALSCGSLLRWLAHTTDTVIALDFLSLLFSQPHTQAVEPAEHSLSSSSSSSSPRTSSRQPKPSLELTLPVDVALIFRLAASVPLAVNGVDPRRALEGEGVFFFWRFFCWRFGFLVGGPLRLSEDTEAVLVVLRAGEASFLLRRLLLSWSSGGVGYRWWTQIHRSWTH